ncbi:MAG: hypothetical protein MJ237_01045 [bacterium]|nr:hypothetical protein [bacterium]
MRQFKKKTIALVLASVITVAGSFAENNYKNTLMGLDFKPSENGDINMVLQTKTAYPDIVAPVKRDANTYILMLPEINSKAETPDLSKAGGNIESVNIKTMPYSSTGKGYTKITIKTVGYKNLTASTEIYIQSNDKPQIEDKHYQNKENSKKEYSKTNYEKLNDTYSNRNYEHKSVQEQDYEDNDNENDDENDNLNEEERRSEKQKPDIENTETNIETPTPVNMSEKEAKHQKYILTISAILICLLLSYLYQLGKEKIANVVGENLDIDINDEKENNKKNKAKSKNIARTINKLDAIYSNPKSMLSVSEYTGDNNDFPKEDNDPVNIVDLDELFKEKKNTEIQTSDSNSALDDFLSDFSFDSEPEPETVVPIEQDTINYDEELYEKVINHSNLTFTDTDISCIHELLKLEIYDDTLNNLEKYITSNPIKNDKNSIQKNLENLITQYTVAQDITFKEADIEIVKNLMSVEIDEDFVNDLKTDPEKTKEFLERTVDTEPRKNLGVTTLHIDEDLPNLAVALKKQGNKAIEYENKTTVYYGDENYSYTKLSTENMDLPDLTIEINNKSAYKSKYSDVFDIVDNSYEVETLKIEDELPDLQDAIKNPRKYDKPEPKPAKVDEKSLLKSLNNVQFKPFYDGNEDFEILNKFDNEPISIAEDIQNELNTVNDIALPDNYETEVEQIKQEELPHENNKINENETKQDKTEEVKAEENKPENLQIKPKLEIKKRPRKNSESVEQLIKKINISKQKQLNKEIEQNKTDDESKNKTDVSTPKTENPKCVFGNTVYEIIDSAQINSNLGCHLVKNAHGYAVLSYDNDDVELLKEYKEIKSPKIQIRSTKNFNNSNTRYLVKTGTYKFIIELADGKVKYIMDLC